MSKSILLLVFAFLCINCSSDNSEPATAPTPTEILYFPPLSGNAWETKSLESLGWKTTAVQPLLDYLELKHTKGFIILVNGRM